MSSFSIKINLDSLGSFKANSYFLLPNTFSSILLLFQSLKINNLNCDVYFYMYICMCLIPCSCSASGFQKRHCVPWNWSYKQLYDVGAGNRIQTSGRPINALNC